jgi:hypothetical protein
LFFFSASLTWPSPLVDHPPALIIAEKGEKTRKKNMTAKQKKHNDRAKFAHITIIKYIFFIFFIDNFRGRCYLAFKVAMSVATSLPSLFRSSTMSSSAMSVEKTFTLFFIFDRWLEAVMFASWGDIQDSNPIWRLIEERYDGDCDIHCEEVPLIVERAAAAMPAVFDPDHLRYGKWLWLLIMKHCCDVEDRDLYADVPDTFEGFVDACAAAVGASATCQAASVHDEPLCDDGLVDALKRRDIRPLWYKVHSHCGSKCWFDDGDGYIYPVGVLSTKDAPAFIEKENLRVIEAGHGTPPTGVERPKAIKAPGNLQSGKLVWREHVSLFSGNKGIAAAFDYIEACIRSAVGNYYYVD